MNPTEKQLSMLRHMLGINDSTKRQLPSRNHAAVDPGDPGYPIQSLGRSMPTQVATSTQDFVVSRSPFLVNYNETGRAHAIDEGLPTQDTRDRFGLVQPTAEIDVDECFFRMLQPHEIQHAMAFPAGYNGLV